MDYHNDVVKPDGRDDYDQNDTLRRTPKSQKLHKSVPMEDYLRRILMVVDQMQEEDTLKKTHARRRVEWMLVAYVVDRFMFFFFIISASFISVIILCQYIYDPQERQEVARFHAEGWH